MLTLVKRAFLKSMNNEETLVTKVLLGLRRCYVDYIITEHQVRGFLTGVCVRKTSPTS